MLIAVGVLVTLIIIYVVAPLCSSNPKLETRWDDYKKGKISFWRDFIFELDLKDKTNKEKQSCS